MTYPSARIRRDHRAGGPRATAHALDAETGFVSGNDRPAPDERPASGGDYTSASFRSSHTGMSSPAQIRRSVFRVRLISPRSSAL